MSGRFHVADQRPDALDVIGRHQALQQEDLLELVVELIGKRLAGHLFDGESAFFALANVAATGALHPIEHDLLVLPEIDLEGAVIIANVRPAGESQSLDIGVRDEAVAQLEMQAAELFKGVVDQGLGRRRTRYAGFEIETHVRRRPTRQRTAQELEAHLLDDESMEAADLFAVVEDHRGGGFTMLDLG